MKSVLGDTLMWNDGGIEEVRARVEVLLRAAWAEMI